MKTVAQFDRPQLKAEGAVRWSADPPGLDGIDRSGSQGIVYLHAGFLGQLSRSPTHPDTVFLTESDPANSPGLEAYLSPRALTFFHRPLGGDVCRYLATSVYNLATCRTMTSPVTLAKESRRPHMPLSTFLGGKGNVLTAIASQKKAQMNTSFNHPLFGIGNRPKAGQNHLFS